MLMGGLAMFPTLQPLAVMIPPTLRMNQTAKALVLHPHQAERFQITQAQCTKALLKLLEGPSPNRGVRDFHPMANLLPHRGNLFIRETLRFYRRYIQTSCRFSRRLRSSSSHRHLEDLTVKPLKSRTFAKYLQQCFLPLKPLPHRTTVLSIMTLTRIHFTKPLPAIPLGKNLAVVCVGSGACRWHQNLSLHSL